MKTVYVVGVDYAVNNMFTDAGWNVEYGNPPPSAQGHIDLVCFTGGADVSPHLYGEENTTSYCVPVRDEFEAEVYEEFIDVKKVGICRGGQFLNVMNGGKMIQHIDGHSMGYYSVQLTGYEHPVTLHEDHHQGIVPPDWEGMELTPDVPYFVLGVDPRDQNVEIVYFPETKSLCFQAHPEWGDEETKDIFFELLRDCLEV